MRRASLLAALVLAAYAALAWALYAAEPAATDWDDQVASDNEGRWGQ